MAQCYDETIGAMESIRVLNRYHDLLVKVIKNSHWNRQEIENLFLIHYKIAKSNGGTLNFKKFEEVLHRVFDFTNDELFNSMYSQFDTSRLACISPEGWAIALSTILKGSLDEKIDYAWNVYDSLRHGALTRDNMFPLLKNSIVKCPSGEDSAEVVRDLVDVVMKKMDLDRDGKLNHNDFLTSVRRNPLLLESLGQVLPSRKSVQAFTTTFTTAVPKF